MQELHEGVADGGGTDVTHLSLFSEIRRFVNGWLAKEQDRGGSAPAPTYQSKAAERNAQYCQHDAPLSPLEKKAVERALAKEAYDERP